MLKEIERAKEGAGEFNMLKGGGEEEGGGEMLHFDVGERGGEGGSRLLELFSKL